MIRRLRPRSLYDVLATLAFFGVLTGGVAYAANTIGSSDIIDESILSRDVKNGQLGTPDLAADAVRTGQVLNESLTGHDIQNNTIGGADVNESLLDPLSEAQIEDESLTGHDIQDNTIGGADVNESLLDPLSEAQIEDESLTGHDIQDNTIGGTDVNESLLDGVAYSPAYSGYDPPDFSLPADNSFGQVIYTGDGTHGDLRVHVADTGLVMANASLNFDTNDGGSAEVTCRLELVGGGQTRQMGAQMYGPVDGIAGTVISLSGATTAEPGNYFVRVICRSAQSGQPAMFVAGNLIAWAM